MFSVKWKICELIQSRGLEIRNLVMFNHALMWEWLRLKWVGKRSRVVSNVANGKYGVSL